MTPSNLQLPKHDEIERSVAKHEQLIFDSAWTGGLVVGGIVLTSLGQLWPGVPALLAGVLYGWHIWRGRRQP